MTSDGVPAEAPPPQAPLEDATTISADRRPRWWSWLRRGWLAWRRWRRTRPFWGGLLLMLGGGWILATVKAPLPVILHIGVQGTAAFVVPLLILLSGALLWFNPSQRLFYSIIGLVMSLVSWLTSNLGGFFLGMLLGMIGGSLAFSWTPRKKPRKRRRRPPVLGAPDDPDDAGMELVTDRAPEHQQQPQEEEVPGRPVG